MPYFTNTTEDERIMLEAIGAKSIDELFEMVPGDVRLDRPLDLPKAMGELELTGHLQRLADMNTAADHQACFLGAGVYDHFIPAIVDHVASRSEFYTAYTPYQAEASQGTLQSIFEYQTLICELTGMDVTNASMYDGATAATEAVLMAMQATRRNQVVTADSVHPEYRQTLETYIANLSLEAVTLKTTDGGIDLAQLKQAVTGETACVLIQHPNFFGCLEDVREIAEIAHAAGALLIVSVDPISLGLLERPGDYGADIVTAEGQSLGIPMGYGGPGLGLLACREQFMRRMPGRLVGETTDRRDRACFVLTMQTREQHIRREKATSNICTNQGLMALRATVYLAAMGPQGLRETANLCLQKSHYAARQLGEQVPGCELLFGRPFFKEFAIRLPQGAIRKLQSSPDRPLLPGVSLTRWYADMEDVLLIAVTEKRCRRQIDELVKSLAESLS